HDAAMVLEIDEARAPEGGRNLLTMMKGGVVVPIGRMKPSQPHGRRIRELVAELRALQIAAHGAVRAHLEVQLEEGASAAAEPWCQEEIQLTHVGALVLGKRGVVVSRADVRKAVGGHPFLRTLSGTGRHLSYRLLDSRQALRGVCRGCRGRARWGCGGRTGLGCCGCRAGAPGWRCRGALRHLCFQIVDPRRQLPDQLQTLIELLFERCDALTVGRGGASDRRMTETGHE